MHTLFCTLRNALTNINAVPSIGAVPWLRNMHIPHYVLGIMRIKIISAVHIIFQYKWLVKLVVHAGPLGISAHDNHVSCAHLLAY